MLDTPTKTTAPISDFAIVVNSVDNVAVVKNETFEGLSMTLPGGGSVMLERAVPPGHRFAICDVPAGEYVLGTTIDPREVFEGLLVIVYRLRNNLFHGLKTFGELNDQRENLATGCSALAGAIRILGG